MDEGEILMEGKSVKIENPLASQLMGISIIYQELSVLDNMNIAENIFLGRERRKGKVFADKKPRSVTVGGKKVDFDFDGQYITFDIGGEKEAAIVF